MLDPAMAFAKHIHLPAQCVGQFDQKFSAPLVQGEFFGLGRPKHGNQTGFFRHLVIFGQLRHAAIIPKADRWHVAPPVMRQIINPLAGQYQPELLDIIVAVKFQRGRLIGYQRGVRARTGQYFLTQRQTLITARRQIIINHQPIIIARLPVGDKDQLVSEELRQVKKLKTGNGVFGNDFNAQFRRHILP